LLKDTGKPLEHVQRLLDSLWAILKGYGKPLGNAPITEVPYGQMFPWLGVMKSWDMRPSDNRRQGKIAQWLLEKTGNISFL
jgi:hypothetical protein